MAVQQAHAATPQRKAPASGEPHPRLVGYFPQWGLYNDPQYTVKDLVQSGGAKMLDQLNYAQGFVTGGRCSVADPNADLNYTFTAQTSVDGKADAPGAALRGNFHQLQELKRRYPRLKIVVSLEGRAADFAADAQPEQRAAFVSSCVDLFLKGNLAPGVHAPGLFDGIDVDWEYPRGADSANYVPLLEEFRRQMDAVRSGLLLTVALGPSPHMYGEADAAAVGRLVDLAGLMTYDFNGPWNGTTGFVAPLSSADGGSVQSSVAQWKAAGIPAEKLLVGIPFYAYGWRQVTGENHGLGQDGRPIRGDHPYRAIEAMIPRTDPPSPATRASQAGTVNTGGASAGPPANVAPTPPSAAPNPAKTGETTTADTAAAPLAGDDPPAAAPPPPAPVLYRDPVSQAPWLFNGSTFWTYEDATSIRAKADYAAKEGLGGFMVWELSDDTSDATLLHAAHDSLHELRAEDAAGGRKNAVEAPRD